MQFKAFATPGRDLAKPCQICTSHKTNADGYLYKTWKAGGAKRREPFYRFLFRAVQGWAEWPVGLEAHHVCENRACCEPSHISAIQRSDHKSVTNTLRYADRLEAAHVHWLVTGCTGTALAELFDVTHSTGCRWIRQWKADPLS